ncbi:MAG TPA: SBBP repeat-containing protein [Verrucomicrobiae bacterium]|nr:SBBP repeat-containing protein [Verrucomicrobiae bacterium]
MRNIRCTVPKSIASLASALAIVTLSGTYALAEAVPAVHGPAVVSRAGWPLFFEPGAGSADSSNYIARGLNYQLRISGSGVEFMLRKASAGLMPHSVRREENIQARAADFRSMRMNFDSAQAAGAVAGVGQLEGKVNYLLGNNPEWWRTEVPVFAQVRVSSLYPGIDLVYYGNHQQLEYDFTIAPQADAHAIKMRFEGVDKLTIAPTGELVIKLGDLELRQHTPVIYQVIRGVRHEVSGGYSLVDSRTAGFKLGPYDREWPLVIDPVFSYSTYFGGNAGDTGLAIKVDKNGAVYLAGETLSTQFLPAATGSPVQSQMHGGFNTGDAFVAKLDNTGSKLIYFTYLGGAGDDGAYDLAIDGLGNAFVTGFTVSPDFPMRNAIYPRISGQPDNTFNLYPVDAFVAELNTNGTALVYSTYLGGSDRDVGSAIALDSAGNTYVTGYTFSTNFPVYNALQGTLAGNDDVFVTKIAAGGSNLVYSTYFGGVFIDEGEGIAVDSAGYACISGYTASTNFPITLGAAQTNLNGSGAAISVYDAFAAKFSPNGQGLVYSTYLGGSQNDYGYRVAVDASGNAYLTGATQSSDMPHQDVFGLTLGENGTNAVNFDAFMTKLSPAGVPLYTAQFGGTANDSGWDLAVDPSGRVFVVGITLSTNFPVANAFDLFRATNSGANDIFVVAFNTNAGPVLYSAYLGGEGNDYGYAIAVDSEANAYISGMTLSTRFPVTAGPLNGALTGSSDAFVAKARLFDPMLTVRQSGTGFELTWPATAPDYQLQSTTNLAPPQVWTAVSQPAVLANGQYLVDLATTNSLTVFRLFRP